MRREARRSRRSFPAPVRQPFAEEALDLVADLRRNRDDEWTRTVGRRRQRQYARFGPPVLRDLRPGDESSDPDKPELRHAPSSRGQAGYGYEEQILPDHHGDAEWLRLEEGEGQADQSACAHDNNKDHPAVRINGT